MMTSSIQLEHLSKRLGSREVLKEVSFNVEPGDIFGYLGPNGAGKTTTIRILLGLLTPTSGHAYILGQDVAKDETRKRVGFVLEADGLYDNMTGMQNMLFFARLYGIPAGGARIQDTLKLVGMSERANDRVSSYSRGMRQRLALARSLVHNPDVLILDEPTSGIDPSGQIEIRQIILDMAHKEGKTILLSSHNLDEIQRIATRIALINRGEIRLCGELDELQRKMSRREVVIKTDTVVPDRIISEIEKLQGITIRTRNHRTITLILSDGATVAPAVALLSQRGVGVEEVRNELTSLEEIYTSILRESEGNSHE